METNYNKEKGVNHSVKEYNTNGTFEWKIDLGTILKDL